MRNYFMLFFVFTIILLIQLQALGDTPAQLPPQAARVEAKYRADMDAAYAAWKQKAVGIEKDYEKDLDDNIKIAMHNNDLDTANDLTAEKDASLIRLLALTAPPKTETKPAVVRQTTILQAIQDGVTATARYDVNKAIVSIKPDGTLATSDDHDSGTWTLKGNLLVLQWKSGHRDSMTFADDGKTAAGTNQQGRKLKLLMADPPASKTASLDK